jgi:chromosome partitioning protein
MRVFAILNQKGGSGKTTTTINLGAALAELGRHVLVLDLDPQASATHWLGADEGDGIYQVVVERLPVGPFVMHTAIDRLDLVPASKKLALVEQDARRKPGGESALRRAIAKLAGPWDFVLMDCPPALGLLTINAMAAADSVIVPVEAHGIALEGIADLTDTIAQVRDAELNPDLQLLAVLACRVNRTRQAREVAEFLETTFPNEALRTRIHENARLGEAFNFRRTVLQYAPESTGAVEYRAAASELLARVARLDNRQVLVGAAGTAGGR